MCKPTLRDFLMVVVVVVVVAAVDVLFWINYCFYVDHSYVPNVQ